MAAGLAGSVIVGRIDCGLNGSERGSSFCGLLARLRATLPVRETMPWEGGEAALRLASFQASRRTPSERKAEMPQPSRLPNMGVMPLGETVFAPGAGDDRVAPELASIGSTGRARQRMRDGHRRHPARRFRLRAWRG